MVGTKCLAPKPGQFDLSIFLTELEMNRAVFSFSIVATFLIGSLCFTDSANAQCCQPAPRTRLALVDHERNVPRLMVDSTTDACGCDRRSLSWQREAVAGKRLSRVPVDPCQERFLKRLVFGSTR